MDLAPVTPTTVGSFPRPHWLATPVQQGSRIGLEFAAEGQELSEAQDDATLLALRDQEEAGLELLTDGEQRRTNFINHILAAWDGIDLGKFHDKAIRRRDRLRPVPTVVGQVRRREPAVVEDLRFAKAHANGPVKMAVPGPMTVIDTTYDEVYGDESALAMDVAAALNAELLELQAAGADMLQIDEPAMTRYHEKAAEYGAKALDRCLEGITVPTVVHLCYGYPGTGDDQHHYKYPELLEALMETRISGFSLEFARSGYDPSILRGCEGRLVLFGCIDPGDSPLEPLQAVVDSVKQALEYVAPENLLVAPDCGLLTAGRELARAKSRLLAATAETVRAKL
jgi:5-methyltetrahydropteroyltriglutamate--homocysteine methyltransferase